MRARSFLIWSSFLCGFVLLHTLIAYEEHKRMKIDPRSESTLPTTYDVTEESLRSKLLNNSRTRNDLKPLCSVTSQKLRGTINIQLHGKEEFREIDGTYSLPPTLQEMGARYKKLELGGFYPGPKECECRSYSAIIVPYRDREEHLRYFLHYMHQILERQQLCYVIIVSEQADSNTFNKGQLMNTAFEYARALMRFDCYIFHDVDMIPEDDRILYNCTNDSVVHLAPRVSKFNYELSSMLSVGGVVGFTERQFVEVNGFSNQYVGWGGEDDDMSQRIKSQNISIWRPPGNNSRFTMINHGLDRGNVVNMQRFERLKLASLISGEEGLNSLRTKLVGKVFHKTHTIIRVKTYTTIMQGLLRYINTINKLIP